MSVTYLRLSALLICALLLPACFRAPPRPPGAFDPFQYDQPIRVESEICAANGVDAPCLRIINESDQTLEELRIGFASEQVDYGTILPNSTGNYVHVPKGVYSYAAYRFKINGEEFSQSVTDFVGERPMGGGAFTYTVQYDTARRYAPIQLVKVVVDDTQRVVREFATPTPRPAMNDDSTPAEAAQNTLDCFTAQEIADAFFISPRLNQRENGDAPFIDTDGALVLHTTAEQFAGDTGHRRFYYDAPYENILSAINLDMVATMSMLKSRFVDRTCDTNVQTYQIHEELNTAPMLESTTLEPYLWNNRLLLIFANSAHDTTYMKQMRTFTGLSHELLDRDMIWLRIFAIGPDSPNVADASMGSALELAPSYADAGQKPIALLPDEFVDQLRNAYNLDGAAFRVVLIGKDGGVKYDTTDLFGPEQLFPIIDAMPMRQQEMKNDNP